VSQIPHDVRVFALDPHQDGRGSFSEIFRVEWSADTRLIQWNLVHSEAGVLRGMHVHRRHSDYLTMAAGRMLLGLCDLRRTSPTYRVAATLELTPSKAVLIPAGVAHGFYFSEAAIHIYAVTHYWDPEDELGCHWSDPELQIPWEVRNPVLSARDAGLPSLARLVKDLA
jgi:dTDP-4-dehydrorhamnose 3,5-epimerase